MLWDLLDMLRGDVADIDMAALLVQFAAIAVVMILCLPAHECAHAWAAKKLGDDTAWMHGRLTLNPSKHLDLLGTLMLFVVGFGYAKPVPVNPRNFKHYWRGWALTSAAGPLANLILAVIFLFLGQLFGTVVSLTGWMDVESAQLVWGFFVSVAAVNVSLMLFNLLPIPPLDGSRILYMILPAKASDYLERYERYIFGAVFVVSFLLSKPLGALTKWILVGLNFLTGLPFFWVEAVI